MKKTIVKIIWKKIKQMLTMEPNIRYETAYREIQQGVKTMTFTYGELILLPAGKAAAGTGTTSYRDTVGIIGGICFL
jgi:hypothetical protein